GEQCVDGQRFRVDESELPRDFALVLAEPQEARLDADRVQRQADVAEVAGGGGAGAPRIRTRAQRVPRTLVEQDGRVPARHGGRFHHHFQQERAQAETADDGRLDGADPAPARGPAIVERLLLGGAKGTRSERQSDGGAHAGPVQVSNHRSGLALATNRLQHSAASTSAPTPRCSFPVPPGRPNRLLVGIPLKGTLPSASRFRAKAWCRGNTGFEVSSLYVRS